MYKINFKKIFTLALMVLFVQFSFAQKSYKLQANPKLVVSGTSTLHDWDMPSDQASGEMVATAESGKITEIESLKITMPAESIKSGKKAMDKKAYEALKTNQHKSVVFTLQNASKNGDNWTFNGSFSIAGVTKNVSLTVKETTTAGKTEFSGSYSFKLSEYNITPPTAVMGTIKTGDEVKVSFDVTFN